MDTVERYRMIIQALLSEYAALGGDEEGVEAQTIFDTQRDHYQLAYTGWQGRKRIYGIAIHLDIKQGKIWLQHNSTELEVGNDLTSRGVPREDIVIGFQPPFVRQYSGYAVG